MFDVILCNVGFFVGKLWDVNFFDVGIEVEGVYIIRLVSILDEVFG